jgi:hypothetical protein
VFGDDPGLRCLEPAFGEVLRFRRANRLAEQDCAANLEAQDAARFGNDRATAIVDDVGVAEAARLLAGQVTVVVIALLFRLVCTVEVSISLPVRRLVRALALSRTMIPDRWPASCSSLLMMPRACEPFST